MPVGRIEFRREALGIPVRPDRVLPIVWRGDVIYAGDRRFAIWARVKITAPVTRLIAVENLRPGVPVKPGQVREEVTEVFPLSSGSRPSLSQIEGLMPLRTIASGAEIRSDDVGQPYEVNRGDLVHVEVRAGAARLALTGRAESAGRVGDLVPVRNLDSSRVFHARVEGKDSVIVLVRDVEESPEMTANRALHSAGILALLVAAALFVTAEGVPKRRKKPVEPSALDKYIQESLKNGSSASRGFGRLSVDTRIAAHRFGRGRARRSG